MQFDSVSTFVLFVFIGGLHKTRKQEEYIERISQVIASHSALTLVLKI